MTKISHKPFVQFPFPEQSFGQLSFRSVSNGLCEFWFVVLFCVELLVLFFIVNTSVFDPSNTHFAVSALWAISTYSVFPASCNAIKKCAFKWMKCVIFPINAKIFTLMSLMQSSTDFELFIVGSNSTHFEVIEDPRIYFSHSSRAFSSVHPFRQSGSYGKYTINWILNKVIQWI